MKDQQRYKRYRQTHTPNEATEAQRGAAAKRHRNADTTARQDAQGPSEGAPADAERQVLSDLLTAAISNLAVARTILNRQLSQVNGPNNNKDA